MKLSKTLLSVFVTFVFTTVVYADVDTLNICKKAENTFWDTVSETHNNADKSLMGSLGEQVQISYYKMALGQIEQSLTEVKNRCKGIASKKILDTYENKKSEIEGKLKVL